MTLEELRQQHNNKQPRKPSSFEESNIQSTFFIWVGTFHPELDKLIFHIANEGKRNSKYVKKSGIKKGVPDVFLSKPNKDYHGLYIEFKTIDGKQSKDQKIFQEQAERVGYQYFICRSAKEGLDIVKEYLNNKNLDEAI